jgi:iron complex transport system substrate-binding protein
MPHRSTPLALLILVTVLLVACGGQTPEELDEAPPPPAEDAVQETEAESEPEEAAVEDQTEPAAESLILTDALGREVTIPANVERVITLAPSVTESLYAIGAGDQVVGRTSFDTYPPEVLDVTEVGGFSADKVNIETVVSLEPDLVLGGSDLQEPLVEAFDASGVTFYIFNPESSEGIYEMLETMGQMTGHEDGAQAVIDDMQTRIAAVQDVIADVPEDERPTVFYEVWDEPLMTAGPETYIGEMLVLAGGVDIFADVEQPYSQISSEIVIERQPAVIMGPDTHGDALTIEGLTQRAGWETIPAVQNSRVYLFDGDVVSHAGPRMADAIELMAASLYPDRFGE